MANDRANQTAVDNFGEKNQDALAWIVSLVDDSQLCHIRALQTAKQACNALKNHHEKSTLSNKVTLMRRICSTKLDEGGDIEQHLAVLSNLFQRLADMGETLQDGWKVEMLLSGLPKSYDALIMALEARSANELTYDLVHEKLLTQHNRKSIGDDMDGESVLKTVNAKGKSCFFCKSGDHFKKDCLKYKQWKKNKEKEDGGKVNKEKAHKVEQSSDSERLFTVLACENNAESKHCDSGQTNEFIFTVAKSCKKGDWIADSGATSHVAGDKQQFSTLNATNAKLQAANGGEVTVEGKGVCKIDVLNHDGQVKSVTVEDVLFAPGIQGNLLSVKRLVEDDYDT